MKYLVSNQQEMFQEDLPYQKLSVEDSLKLMESWKLYQFDSETNGKNPHLNKLLCIQFGNDATDTRICVDATTVDITVYKEFMESRLMIGHNLKFDLQFLFPYKIYPRRVYDTMIVQQFLYLGYPTGKLKKWQENAYMSLGFTEGKIGFSLQYVAKQYLGVYIDKTVRGEIIYRGLVPRVVIYALGDVEYLEKIMLCQKKEFIKRNAVAGVRLECYAVPAMAYLEWSGIKLDEKKWKAKMVKDKIRLDERTKTLNTYFISLAENRYPQFRQYVYVDNQGDLFTGYNLEQRCSVNWGASAQVIKIAKVLGFDTAVIDKETGEEKDTVLEKELAKQKGIDDEFLKCYFDFKEAFKIVTTYGQGHLDLINPVTGRLHTSFKQLGAATGRMSSGGGYDEDLTKFKNARKKIKLVNMQQLPHDAETRSCFIAEQGNRFVSCDFSAEESRLGADVYDDDEMRKEFTERTGDTHAMFAWAVFRKECESCGCTSALEVKKKAPQWRNKVKSVEFAYLFGAAAPTIAKSAGCSEEQAQKYIDDLNQFFKGRTKFTKKGSAFVRNNGYVLISPITGHRVNWWDWKLWKERQKTFTPEFWEEFRTKHKGTGDSTAQLVRMHFKAASKYDRYALNSPTQGTGAIIMKDAMTALYNYIIKNNLFDVVRLCVVVHDEINCEYPENMVDFPDMLAEIMKTSAAKYCKSLDIPACPEVGDHWIH